jgi:hypothetical protein
MQTAKQREDIVTRSGAVVTRSSAHFRKMIQRCEAKAAAATGDDDRTYWLGLAQIWSRAADREEQ